MGAGAGVSGIRGGEGGELTLSGEAVPRRCADFSNSFELSSDTHHAAGWHLACLDCCNNWFQCAQVFAVVERGAQR